ncbi:MAG: hypothetical protein AB7O97_21835 [Planctomycetota bacterium]
MRSAVVFLATVASGCTAVYGGYSVGRPNYAVLPNRAALVGGTLGAERWPARSRLAGYTEFQVRADGEDNLTVVELVGGGRFAALQTDDVRIGVEADLGFAQADLQRFRNSNELLTAAAGAFARVRAAERVWLMTSVGGRAYWDVTDPRTSGVGASAIDEDLGDSIGIDFFVGLLVEF